MQVLIIIAHPDDEVIGCGGTICYHKLLGHHLSLVCSTNGVGSRDNVTPDQEKERELACINSSKLLGIENVHNLSFPDNSMDTIPFINIVKEFECIIDQYNPDIIYTHHNKDLNIDHRIVANAVVTATRPIPKQKAPNLYSMEILSSTDWSFNDETFKPNVFVDISNVFEKKFDALKAYNTEIRQYPHSRSYGNIENLARLRGCTIGVEYAEAFQLIREIKY